MIKFKQLDRNELIKRLKKLYDNKYDFSYSEYIGMDKPFKYLCNKHGWQQCIPLNLVRGHGCKECYLEERNNKNYELFLERFKKLYKDSKYDFSKYIYHGSRIKGIVICPIHGEFNITASNLLAGHGCPKCGIIKNSNNRKYKFEKFLEEARVIHGNKYDYDKKTYVDRKTKMRIIDKKYGEFWQSPQKHLCGQGCPKRKSSKLENQVINYLENNNIEYIYQYRFNEYKLLPYDFYLPKYKTLIECQGEQHFKPVDFYNSLKDDKKINKIFIKRIKMDLLKYQIAIDNNINIIYIINNNNLENSQIKHLYDNKIVIDNINNLKL